jgi:hypothetical protein
MRFAAIPVTEVAAIAIDAAPDTLALPTAATLIAPIAIDALARIATVPEAATVAAPIVIAADPVRPGSEPVSLT